MKKIWVFAEYVHCTLDRVTLELLTKATELESELKGETEVAPVLIGSRTGSTCKTLAAYGAEKI